MRTLSAGMRALRRTPAAVIPLSIEGVVVGVLVLLGVFPASAESAAAGAVFPLDLYFDLKQNLAFSLSWRMLLAGLMVSVLVRSGLMAATLWLAEEKRASLLSIWFPLARLGALAVALFAPAGVLMYLGTALRYSPFVAGAALLGIPVAVVVIRRALRQPAGSGLLPGSGVPEVGGFLAYAYAICALGAAMSSLGRISVVPVGLLLMTFGPLSAVFLLGWREHLRDETYPGAGTYAVGITALATVLFLGAVLYDRAIHDPAPVAVADTPGTLLLLGGVDSTSRTGALTEVDPRDLGFDPEASRRLSYRRSGRTYDEDDTRRDLRQVAAAVSKQIDEERPPRLLLGHSQASLIIDRMVDGSLVAPDRSVVLAAAPPRPPPLTTPLPGESGGGAVAADVARAAARLFDAVGIPSFDIDAPASPTRLDPVVVIDREVSRVSIWAIGDSVWLDGDWRRPGEINLVAMTDHVGVTNDERALEAARDFLAGGDVEGDEVSWRGFLVAALRYAFEPWRPG